LPLWAPRASLPCGYLFGCGLSECEALVGDDLAGRHDTARPSVHEPVRVSPKICDLRLCPGTRHRDRNMFKSLGRTQANTDSQSEQQQAGDAANFFTAWSPQSMRNQCFRVGAVTPRTCATAPNGSPHSVNNTSRNINGAIWPASQHLGRSWLISPIWLCSNGEAHRL